MDHPCGRGRALPYLVLLRAGFCLPLLLPEARCALTAPFHPYPPSPSAPSGLGLRRARLSGPHTRDSFESLPRRSSRRRRRRERRRAVSFLCHWSVGLPRPGVTRRTVLVEFGLSSPGAGPPRPRLVAEPRAQGLTPAAVVWSAAALSVYTVGRESESVESGVGSRESGVGSRESGVGSRESEKSESRPSYLSRESCSRFSIAPTRSLMSTVGWQFRRSRTPIRNAISNCVSNSPCDPIAIDTWFWYAARLFLRR